MNMNKDNDIKLSIVVPVYNTERYLAACLESLKAQGDLPIEVILVDDGSTDGSAAIAEAYVRDDARFHLLRRANGGASAARNTGLAAARGEYVAFVDSDDLVEAHSLPRLYGRAVDERTDVVMGNVWLCDEAGQKLGLFEAQTDQDLGIHTGPDAFMELMRRRCYLPMPFKYIYRRSYLERLAWRFEEGIMHEDELWTPVVLRGARRVALTNVAYYRYRQNAGSVMHATGGRRRLRSLSRVAEGLFRLADGMSYEGEEGALRSWWTANAYRLYAWACDWLPRLRDSSLAVSTEPLERFGREAGRMLPEAVARTRRYYESALGSWRRYTDWRLGDGVASVAWARAMGRRLLLIYNTPGGDLPSWDPATVPEGWVATSDRRYTREADAVAFHLPTLHAELDADLDKPESQRWIHGFREAEADDATLRDPEIAALFDGAFHFPPEEGEAPFPMAAALRALG